VIKKNEATGLRIMRSSFADWGGLYFKRTDFFIDKDIAKGYSLIGDRRVVIAEVFKLRQCLYSEPNAGRQA
jgi:hypothetical protein